jgi:hypothetical protein
LQSFCGGSCAECEREASGNLSVLPLHEHDPNLHFIIDRHRSLTAPIGWWWLSACSGTGFKFATAVGDKSWRTLVADGMPRFDLDMFRMTRFQCQRRSIGVRVVLKINDSVPFGFLWFSIRQVSDNLFRIAGHGACVAVEESRWCLNTPQRYDEPRSSRAVVGNRVGARLRLRGCRTCRSV